MLKRLKKGKFRKGFTLIELILVIAIIGILGAIVIPKISGVAEEASNKADKASARTIESAVNLALLDGKDVNADAINMYLSNIEVQVLDGANNVEEDVWYVEFLDKGELKIFKGKTPIPTDNTD